MPMTLTAEPPAHMRAMGPEHLTPLQRRLGGVPPRKRASGLIERYLVTDPRVTSGCQHTQIQDILVGATAYCLDCGSVIDIVHNWTVVPGSTPLTDSQLTAKRRQHNDFWFDRTYKKTPPDPDDPALDAIVNAALTASGIVRL
jgi:hypothetical protein